MKKFLILISIFSLSASFLFAQSLSDLSKKEKERREKLKGKTSIVLTNTDLKKARRPARIPVSPSLEEEESAPEEATEETPSDNRIIPTQRAPQEESESDSAESQETTELSLEEKWEKAKEYVALLTLKMNALWQEFYSMDDMTPRDYIQQQISETYQKLQEAQEEEEKLRQELGK
jgi:hypothetical protein